MTKTDISERTIYKDPINKYVSIQNQALMQFFGGKTGGKSIETTMNRLGLSMEKQKQREKSYQRRNDAMSKNHSGSSMGSQT